MIRHAAHRTATYLTTETLESMTSRSVLCRTSIIQSSRLSRPGAYISRNIESIATPQLSSPELKEAFKKVLPLPEAVHSLSDQNAQIFNETFPAIRRALSDNNIPEAWRLWSILSQEQLLALFGPSHHEMNSRLLANYCKAQDLKSSWGDERTLVEEMALYTAGGGYTGGLKACLTVHLRRRDPAAVHRLYERYTSLLKEKGMWRDLEDRAGQANLYMPEGEQVDQDTSSRSESLQAPAANGAGQGGDSLAAGDDTKQQFLNVRSDILLCSIAAHAMQDAFLEALSTSLQTSTRISHASVLGFLRNIGFNQELRKKVESYAHRIDLARLLSRPSSFSNQLSNLTKDHADKSLERLYNSIIDELTVSNPWLAAKPSDVSASTPVLLLEFAWASLLTGFLQCRRLDLAEKLWDDLIRLKIQPTVGLWTALINGYAHLRMVEPISGAWNMMKEQGIKPDAHAWRALIYGLFHAGLPEQALTRFQEFQKVAAKMSHAERPQTLMVYNTAIHGLLFHSMIKQAQAILKQMQEEGPKPDIVTYNTFMRYYGRVGHLKAFAGVLEMLDNEGLVGDVFTFSTLLTTLLKVRQDATQVMLGLMRKQGVQPNVAMYTSIIDHLLKQQRVADFKAAIDILNRMEQDGSEDVHPNEITYTTVLTGILRSNFLDAATAEEYRLDIMQRMKKRDITPSRVTYHFLIRACLENPEPQGVVNALEYYREIIKQRIFIGNDTWYMLLQGLIRRDEWEVALEVVDDVQKTGFIPAAALSDLIHRVRKQSNRRQRRQSTDAI